MNPARDGENQETARQAPRRGGRSAVIAHPDSVRSANRRSARPWALVSQTKPPAPRRFRGRAPAARNPCWSHCPFPGLIGTITPALRGGTSRAAPHVRGTDRRVARPPTSGTGLGAWLHCPLVNGAGADRYWPVGSGGHGPFVRALARLERAADRFRAARHHRVAVCCRLLVLLVPSPRGVSGGGRDGVLGAGQSSSGLVVPSARERSQARASPGST